MIAYAASAALAVVWLLAALGAACVLVEGALRVRRWLHRGEL